MTRRATRVGVLVRLPATGELTGETVGDAVVAVGVLRRDRGRAHDHLGTVGPQHVALVLADLVGTHEHALVAALLRDQGQADAGVAGGGLDDRPARLQFTRRFGRIDHLHRDAVLGASAGIEVFDLRRYEPRSGFHHRVELDEGGVSDEVDDGIRNAHDSMFPRRGFPAGGRCTPPGKTPLRNDLCETTKTPDRGPGSSWRTASRSGSS